MKPGLVEAPRSLTRFTVAALLSVLLWAMIAYVLIWSLYRPG